MAKKQIAELKLPETYDEIVVDVVGNVDSGKSSLCGILSHPLLRDDINNINKVLDDGNGSARSRVLSLKHEQSSGRTSSISYNYMIFDRTSPRPRIVSLVDLAGHEQYLKTTITGVVSSYPEHGLVLIAKNITQMTREHFAILASMCIPVLFVLTKIDIIPEHTINDNIKRIGILAKRYGKTSSYICNSNDVKDCINNNKVFGYIKISNKNGKGLGLLAEYISQIKHHKKEKNLIKGFAIDRVYNNITGFGMVVSGITGIDIKKGSSMLLGPFKNNEFINIKIRSIHNDYRHFIDILPAGIRGCLCIRIDDKYKNYLRMGMVICHKVSDVSPVKKFQAHVAIFRGKSSNIKVGFNSYINIGMVRGGIIFNRFRHPDTMIDINGLMETTHTLVDLEFMNHYNAININDRFLFRSGRVNGIGKVVSINPT